MSFVNPLHIAFVAIVALLVLGPKRFPEVARSVGNGYREFREQLSAVTQQAHIDLTAPAAGTPTVENATVVEQISPDRETLLTPPTPETSVTMPGPAGAVVSAADHVGPVVAPSAASPPVAPAAAAAAPPPQAVPDLAASAAPAADATSTPAA